MLKPHGYDTSTPQGRIEAAAVIEADWEAAHAALDPACPSDSDLIEAMLDRFLLSDEATPPQRAFLLGALVALRVAGTELDDAALMLVFLLDWPSA